MKRHIGLAVMALTLALGPGMVATPRPAMAAEQASETVAGKVTMIDLDHRRVTVRNSDGTTYEFAASVETLKDLKVGDSIEARRRPANANEETN